MNAKGILAEQLGYGSGDAALMKLSKDLEGGNIGADAAINALMEGLQASYSGLDAETARSTASGIVSQIKDTFKIDVVKRWGKGLQEGAVDALSSTLDLIESNDEAIVKLGDAFYSLGKKISSGFANVVEKTTNRIMKAVDTEEFENASIGDKIEILWDEVIANPFSEWWDSKGKKMVAEKAEDIGTGIGEGLTAGLLGLLGIDVTGATVDGVSIGGAFAKGIAKGFDGSEVAKAICEAVKNGLKDALKILPGGEKATDTSWLSAIIVGGLGLKMGGGKLLSKAGSKLLSSFTGKGNLAAGVKTVANGADDYAAWWSNQKLWKLNSRGSVIAENQELWRNSTNIANAASKFSTSIDNAASKFSGLKNIASDKATQGVSKMLSAFGSGGKLSELASVGSKLGKFAKGNWLSLLFSGAAIFSAEDKVKETAKQGAGLAGSAAGGALGAKVGGAIGTAIMPGTGTAIGAGIGGLVGSVAGYTAAEKGTGKLWDVDWKGIGDSISSFFTETIPKEWGDFIEPAKTFFAVTIPEKWDGFVESGKKFFTETIPGKWEEATSAASTFFTETLPGKWEEAKDSAYTFFTETLPYNFGELVGKAGVLFTETLPKWWSDKIEVVETFFAETLPKWWGEKVEAAGTFFTETLPGWWNETVDSVTLFWTKTVPGHWNAAADTIASGWDTVRSYFMKKADAIGSWFNEKAESVKTSWNTFKDNFSKGKEDAEAKHASGGIFSSPHIGLVAEDGPEAIIPLGSKRRQRGLDLWMKAGAAMGVTAYANGGIVGGNVSNTSSGTGTVNVGGVTVNITVDGGSGTLLDTLNGQSEEIKEAIAGILYAALSESFQNQPILI